MSRTCDSSLRCISAITLVSRRPGDQGFASPVLFVVGGWLYMEGRMVEAWDEEEAVQDIEDESE
jgi:hypothetical protein